MFYYILKINKVLKFENEHITKFLRVFLVIIYYFYNWFSIYIYKTKKLYKIYKINENIGYY